MLLFDVDLVFVRCSYHDLHVMKGGEENLNGGFKVPNSHSTKTALCNEVYIVCTHLSCIALRIYASGRVKATLGYRF